MFPSKNRSINRWAAFMVLAFMLLFSVIFSRFVYLAHAKEVDAHDLVKLGKQKWTDVKVLDSSRGTIFDSNGRILAHDIPSYTLYAVLSPKAKPNYVKNKQKTAEELAPYIGLTTDEVLSRLNSPGAYQVQFGTKANNLSIQTMLKIKNLHLPGINFTENTIRYYPNQDFASYVLGFTSPSKNGKKQVGRMGIEESLNKYLTETDGMVRFYTDSSGVEMPDAHQKIQKPRNGDNVYLTLDSRIQTVLDEAMSKVNAKFKPVKMIGIAADPKTGKILAMSNYPSFNPNKRNITNYTNFAISAPFEPGSTMKMFTLAAALNEGKWPGNQTYQSGSYSVGGITIHDWNPQGWGQISFNQGLERSSNVAFSILANKYLGTDTLFKYLDAFGFNKKTGIDLPSESNSLLAETYKASRVSTAFGQGSAVTPIQLVQAATAIANNGKMMKPYIVNKIVDPNTHKVVLQNKPTVAGTPITKATAVEERQLLRTVVTGKYGTGHAYNIKGYRVVGKTGTAQIPSKQGGYIPGAYVDSFLGMAPENNPKLIVYVAIDRPQLKDGETESQAVSDVFNPVMSNGLQYLNITPNKNAIQTKVDQIKLGDYTGESIQSTADALSAKGLNVETIGEGSIIRQYPIAGDTLLNGNKVFLLGQGPYKLPDLSGWSLADVLKLSDLLGLKVKSQGSGYVLTQSPTFGSTVNTGDKLNITLGDPTKADSSKSTTTQTDTTSQSTP